MYKQMPYLEIRTRKGGLHTSLRTLKNKGFFDLQKRNQVYDMSTLDVWGGVFVTDPDYRYKPRLISYNTAAKYIREGIIKRPEDARSDKSFSTYTGRFVTAKTLKVHRRIYQPTTAIVVTYIPYSLSPDIPLYKTGPMQGQERPHIVYKGQAYLPQRQADLTRPIAIPLYLTKFRGIVTSAHPRLYDLLVASVGYDYNLFQVLDMQQPVEGQFNTPIQEQPLTDDEKTLYSTRLPSHIHPTPIHNVSKTCGLCYHAAVVDSIDYHITASPLRCS
jgi:hypothetical protein